MVRALLLLVLLLAAGCAPRLSPAYRDFQVRSDEATAPLGVRLRDAAETAGWTLASPPGAVVVATEPRRVATGLASTTEAALELVPLDGGYVRVYVRAERRSLLGGRSKVYALGSGLRSDVLGALTDALAVRGIVALDAPVERDENATD